MALSKAEKQKWFNKAYKGLKKQGFKQAINADGNCMYSLANGRRCAIGQLVPNGTRGVRGWSGSCYFERETLEACGIPISKDRDFFSNLQAAHDASDSDKPEGMKVHLAAFARARGLTVPR